MEKFLGLTIFPYSPSLPGSCHLKRTKKRIKTARFSFFFHGLFQKQIKPNIPRANGTSINNALHNLNFYYYYQLNDIQLVLYATQRTSEYLTFMSPFRPPRNVIGHRSICYAVNYVLESIECFRYGLSITGRYAIEEINGEPYGIAFSAEDEEEQNIR